MYVDHGPDPMERPSYSFPDRPVYPPKDKPLVFDDSEFYRRRREPAYGAWLMLAFGLALMAKALWELAS